MYTTREHCRTLYQQYSFLPRTIRDWNDLPQEVNEAKTIDILVSRASRLQYSKRFFYIFFSLLTKVTKWQNNQHDDCDCFSGRRRRRTRDGTCVLFCVLPSRLDVNRSNKCILSLNESNEELRTKRYVLFIFHSSCFIFSRLCNQSRGRFGVTTIYPRRTKIKRTLSSIGKRPTTQIQVAAGKPGWPGGESCAQD